MVLIGAIGVGDVGAVLQETGGVLLFLVGMMVLTDLVERAGVFDWLADGCARLAGGSGILLFVNIFLLGAVVTALLSLDVTVIMLTPIVYALTVRRRLDALLFMFACTFVANTSSLVFPMSNLTNLLVYSQLHIGFAEFTARLWVVNLVAVAVNPAIFLWLFRDRLPGRFAPAGSGDSRKQGDWWFAAAALVLAGTLVGLIGLGLAGLPLAWGSLAGVGVLLAIGFAGRKVRGGHVVQAVSWPLFVFIVGMFLVVRGFSNVWLTRLDTGLPTGTGAALLVGALGSAVGSNIVNNIPMTVFALSFLGRMAGDAQRAMAYGTVVGANIGPTLTTYGSLATMLWLTIVRRRGIAVSSRTYMRVGVLTMPPVLAAAVATFWLVLRCTSSSASMKTVLIGSWMRRARCSRRTPPGSLSTPSTRGRSTPLGARSVPCPAAAAQGGPHGAGSSSSRPGTKRRLRPASRPGCDERRPRRGCTSFAASRGMRLYARPSRRVPRSWCWPLTGHRSAVRARSERWPASSSITFRAPCC